MSELEVKIQPEGGLTPHRDERMEAGLIEEAKKIQGILRIADTLDALAGTIRAGEIKSRTEITEAIIKVLITVNRNTFFPNDIVSRENGSDD